MESANGSRLAEILLRFSSLSLSPPFFLSRFLPFSRLIDTELATDFNLLLISFDPAAA